MAGFEFIASGLAGIEDEASVNLPHAV